jgi:hypothetical protein
MTIFLERGGDLVPVEDIYLESKSYLESGPIGAIPRTMAFTPPPPPDWEARALRAIERYLEDEYAFMLGGNNDPKVDEYGDGAQMVNYKARELQMYVAQVVEKLTGKPMPTGTVRHPWQDEMEAMGPQRCEDYPDLPSIGGEPR